jgi:hypothetical protein
VREERRQGLLAQVLIAESAFFIASAGDVLPDSAALTLL